MQILHTKIFPGEHLSDSYKNSISRFNKIPVIHHNGFKLTESVAIFHYLSRQGIIPSIWNPSDSKERAKIDEYNEWEHNNLRMTAGDEIIHKEAGN